MDEWSTVITAGSKRELIDKLLRIVRQWDIKVSEMVDGIYWKDVD